MRRKRSWAFFALLAGLLWPEPGFADFNPAGRRKASKPPAAAKRPSPTSKSPARKNQAPRKNRGPDDPEATSQPTRQSSSALIDRYTKIVMQQPGAVFPLQRLAQLYRERDGNLDKLVVEFESRAQQAGPNQWNARVALAGIYKQAGQTERAIQAYEQVSQERPKRHEALLALAQLFADAGDKVKAKQRFEQVLPLLKNAADQEQVLRALLALNLDLKDFEAAKSVHTQLVKRAKGSFFARAELGRELLLRGEYARAEAEYRETVKAAAGDNRALAPALRDLGKALARQKKSDEALKTLQQALRIAGNQSGLRREIFDLIVEVYRADERLTELVQLLEKEAPRDFERLRLLGQLYEETGQIEKAMSTYQVALKQRQKDIDVRLKLVQLLQIQGDLDQAIAQYEQLVKAAPNNPDFVFQLAEALLQRGDRPKALTTLKSLEARSQNDEEILAALVDFYERVDERDRALTLLERLAASQGRDPQHIIELGDRYFEQGDKQRAMKIWQRILQYVPDKAQAKHTLGEVYLQHDMPEEALEAFQEAIKLAPKDLRYKKGYALALERTGSGAARRIRNRHYLEAQRIWEEMLRDPAANSHAQREARQHIVTLWSLNGTLRERLSPLEQRLSVRPPDLNAGRLLAESYLRLRSYPEAERVLRVITKKAPGDVESHLQLERAQVAQRKLKSAIITLKKLVEVEPKRAREYYQRMAGYAAEMYQDDEAVAYAAKAVQLSPDDANGHRKLGEMYRRRQQNERAISEFRKAISKNDRLFPVYFDLAELLINQQKTEEADRFLRRVVRASPDEELVARAARLSMQLNLGTGTLESLEKELLPVALSNPKRPIYRRILVEIYGALAFPLIHEARNGDAKQRAQAHEELRRIGQRAVKPLLDALSDDRDAQQHIAIELLTHIQNPGAGPALFAFATGEAEPTLRARAMLAVAALADPAMLPRLEELVLPRNEPRIDEADPVIVGAAFAIARTPGPKARALTRRLLDSGAGSIRALSAVSLGLRESTQDISRLAEMAADPNEGHHARAAAAFALGALGASRHVQLLESAAQDSDARFRAAALTALARIHADSAPKLIAQGLVARDELVRSAAAGAARVWVSGKYIPRRDALEPTDQRIVLEDILLRVLPGEYPPEVDAQALEKLAEPIAHSATAAAQSSPEGASQIASMLLARDGQPAFGELSRRFRDFPSEVREAAEEALNRISQATVAPFISLTQHPSPPVRATAVRVLGTRSEREAQRAVLAALQDEDPQVQRAGLGAVLRGKLGVAAGAVIKLTGRDNPWPVRARAAEVLAELGQADEPKLRTTLEQLASADPNAFVREAALEGLYRLDPKAARPLLLQRSKNDPEPRVRAAAANLLGQ